MEGLYVRFKNYKNDFTKYEETKHFYSLKDLKNYLIREIDERMPRRTSVWWKNPIGAYQEKGINHGWVSIDRRDNSIYSLWVQEIRTDSNVIVFEKEKYCSQKVYDFLKEFHDEIETNKPIYGEIAD